MPQHVLNFDLTRLTGRMINLLLRGSLEAPEPPPLVGAVRNLLTREQLRRAREEEYGVVSLDLPFFTREELMDAYDHLISDVRSLERAAVVADIQHEKQEREELRDAAAFLAEVAAALIEAPKRAKV